MRKIRFASTMMPNFYTRYARAQGVRKIRSGLDSDAKLYTSSS